MAVKKLQYFAGGKWLDSACEKYMDVFNPSTGEVIAETPCCTSEEVEAAIKGMLAPKYRDVEMGKAEVRSVFKLSSAGTIAGCYITDGKITRNCKIRVVRDGIVVFEDEISSLKRFKDDVKEVATGYECGVGLVKFNDIKEGDILEGYITEEYKD